MTTASRIIKRESPIKQIVMAWLNILYGWKQLKSGKKFTERDRRRFSNEYVKKIHKNWCRKGERTTTWEEPEIGFCQGINGTCRKGKFRKIIFDKQSEMVHHDGIQHGLLLSIVLCIMLYLYFCVIIFI